MKLSSLCSTSALCLALLTGATAIAQAGPAPEQRQQPAFHQHHRHNPEHETRKLTRELNLTPDQAARIEPILAARHQQMHALRENGNATAEQRHEIARSTRGQIDSVLTEQQRQQLHALRAQHHHREQQPSPAPAV